METELRTLLVSSTRGQAELAGVSISHSAWPATQHITSDISPGFTATLETSETVDFVYVPLTLKRAAQKNNLSQRFELTINDLNEIIAPLLDLIPIGTDEKPQIDIRSFVYDDDTGVSIIQDGPYRLKANDIGMVPKGIKTTADPRNLTATGTGRRMTPDRIPMLRGFSK